MKPLLLSSLLIFTLGAETVAAEFNLVMGDVVYKDTASADYCTKPDFDDYVGPCRMTQYNARAYCANLEPKGTHRLPTAREWAEYATSQGAKGILEPKEYEAQREAGRDVSDYIQIITVKDYGYPEDWFYYSNSGFVSASSDWFSYMTSFWSLSLYPVTFHGRYDTALEFGAGAVFTTAWQGSPTGNAVRCVRNK